MDPYTWRIIHGGMGTLREIEEHWSISDVLDAIEYLDFREDVDNWNAKKKADAENAAASK